MTSLRQSSSCKFIECLRAFIYQQSIVSSTSECIFRSDHIHTYYVPTRANQRQTAYMRTCMVEKSSRQRNVNGKRIMLVFAQKPAKCERIHDYPSVDLHMCSARCRFISALSICSCKMCVYGGKGIVYGLSEKDRIRTTKECASVCEYVYGCVRAHDWTESNESVFLLRLATIPFTYFLWCYTVYINILIPFQRTGIEHFCCFRFFLSFPRL